MKILQANGAHIPALGLGTFQLQGDQCVDIVSTALTNGYRHIDTAAFYENEVEVGQAIRKSGRPRDQVFLTTKVWPSEVRQGAFQKSVETSLDRLGLDFVDLLLIHWPPQDDAIEAWAKLLCGAVDRGWTRHIGVSNFTTELLDRFVSACPMPLAVNQVENHPYIDQSKVRASCARHGMALMAYCPLGKGGAVFRDPVILQLSEARNKSPGQIILRWHMQFEGAGAIPKTATPARLLENLDVFDFELDGEEMRMLNDLTHKNQRHCDYDFSPTWDLPEV